MYQKKRVSQVCLKKEIFGTRKGYKIMDLLMIYSHFTYKNSGLVIYDLKTLYGQLKRNTYLICFDIEAVCKASGKSVSDTSVGLLVRVYTHGGCL